MTDTMKNMQNGGELTFQKSKEQILKQRNSGEQITGWKTDLVQGMTTIFQVCKVKYKL